MAHPAKTVSIRHPHKAVKTALEATKKDHPAAKITVDSGPLAVLPIYFRYPWIAGIPPFPFAPGELDAIAAATSRFAASLSADPQVAVLALGGNFEPALHVAGNTVAIGIVPADVSITE